MKNHLLRSVRFDRKQYARLEKIAAERHVTITELLRIVIGQYLDRTNAFTSSQVRQARLIEFAQAALDTIILEQHPEHRDRLVEETRHRMERYHGA